MKKFKYLIFGAAAGLTVAGVALAAAGCQKTDKFVSGIQTNLYIDGTTQAASTAQNQASAQPKAQPKGQPASQPAKHAAFSSGTPLRIFVWERPLVSLGNYASAPYQTVSATTRPAAGDATGERSEIVLDSANPLIIRGGHRYDFAAVVDNARTNISPNWNGGQLTDFRHGMDILAARLENLAVETGTPKVDLLLTSPNLDGEGKLPHLGSAVAVEVSATQRFIDYFEASPDGKLDMGIAGLEFRTCLPAAAMMPLGGSSMALNVPLTSVNTTYTATASAPEQAVADPSVKVSSSDGYVLPFPARYPANTDHPSPYNLLNLYITVSINGNSTLFPATSAAVPAFEPGLRYRFLVEMDRDEDAPEGSTIALKLEVSRWDSVSWNAGMGSTGDENLMLITIGSWSGISWNAPVGATGDKNKTILTVGGWSNLTWVSDMGKYE